MSVSKSDKRGSCYRLIQLTIIVSILFWSPFCLLGLMETVSSTLVAVVAFSILPITLFFSSMFVLEMLRDGFDYRLFLMQLVATIFVSLPAAVFSVQGLGGNRALQAHLNEYVGKAESALKTALERRIEGRKAIENFKSKIDLKANLEAKGISVGEEGKGPIYHTLTSISELATLVLTDLDSEEALRTNVDAANKIILEMREIENNESLSHGKKAILLAQKMEELNPALQKLDIAAMALESLKNIEAFSRFGLQDKAGILSNFRESMNADNLRKRYYVAPSVIGMDSYEAISKYWRSISYVWAGVLALLLWPLIANLLFALTRPKNRPGVTIRTAIVN